MTEVQRGERAFSEPLRGLAWASQFWPSPGKVMPKADGASLAPSSLSSSGGMRGCDGTPLPMPTQDCTPVRCAQTLTVLWGHCTCEGRAAQSNDQREG